MPLIFVLFFQTSIACDASNRNEEDEKLFDSLNSIIDLINAEEEVINFLIENKDNWQVENGSIAFTSDSLIDKYNMLLAAINNENI